MTKIVQQVGGSKPVQDAYTGPAREVTVDTDNWDLRLHDGVTPGGYTLPNRDNLDERYHPKSIELLGLAGFAPEQRGLLVRVGPGDYRIRAIAVNTQQFDLTNPFGYAGNPLIALKERIETAHIWAEDQLFEGVIQVDGGVNANTSGAHFGPVTGDVVGNLTGNTTGTHTGPHVGDVDVRGETLQLDDNQIPNSKIAGLSEKIFAEAIPLGIIMMWSGSPESIPVGFHLCDGGNGTPDLRNRFIVGAGDTYDPGDTGGQATHSHNTTMDADGLHSHPINISPHILTEAEIPTHKHGNGVADKNSSLFNHGSFAANPTRSESIDNNSSSGVVEGWTTSVGGGLGHDHGASSDANGSHTHALNNPSVSNIPPYYALCYIMRGA